MALPTGDRRPLPERFHRLIEYGILASERAPSIRWNRPSMPLGVSHLAGSEHLHTDWRIAHEYSLSAELLAMCRVWQGRRQAQVAATKGAPGRSGPCATWTRFARSDPCRRVGHGDAGLRVLGVAQATLPGDAAPPPRQHDIPFAFVGLVGLEDPVRAVCRKPWQRHAARAAAWWSSPATTRPRPAGRGAASASAT